MLSIFKLNTVIMESSVFYTGILNGVILSNLAAALQWAKVLQHLPQKCKKMRWHFNRLISFFSGFNSNSEKANS